MKSRKLLLSLAVFFLVGAFAPAKATPTTAVEGEEVTDPIVTGWHQIGPNNVAGRVRTIMFDKFNEGVIYACSPAGGLFISVNDGNNWQEIPLGEGENRSYVATSIAQDDNGVLYVGTGEGFYNESEAGYKHFKTGLPGNGVYKSNTFNKNWAADLQNDEAKYQFVAENISFTQMEETIPEKYNIMSEWIYINDMAYSGGKLFVATKNGGLKVFDGIEWTDKSIDGNPIVNVTDIKVSANGEIAVAYILNDDAAVAVATDANADFINNLTKDRIDLNDEDVITKIELSYSLNNSNQLYALMKYYKVTEQGAYAVEAIYRRNGETWEKATPNSFVIGSSDGMSLAINDRDEELIYAAGTIVVSGFNANNDPVFYYNTIAAGYEERNSGAYVAPGIHAIAFDPTPETAEDSIKIYLATDAGIYIYKQDPLTYAVQWHASNKGLVSSQYYNVASTNDGAVFGAGQSNAITYIPTPDTSIKSAETIWSPNSTGYSAIANEIAPYFTDIASQTGNNVLASAVHQTLPSVKKPVILSRPYFAITRTYSDNNDYETINDQTWSYGSGRNLSFMHGNVTNDVTEAPEKASFIHAMELWESFDAPVETRNNVFLKMNDKLTIRRNGTNYMYSHGFELKDGDSVLVQSNNLGYPFFYVFTAEEYGEVVSEFTGEEILDFTTTEDTAINVPSPIQARFLIGATNGLYLCNEVINFTKTYSAGNTSSLPWIKLYHIKSAEEGKHQIRSIAASANGNNVLMSIDIAATGNTPANTKLYRISGLHQYDLSSLSDFNASSADATKFTVEEIGTFNRSISSIVYANDSTTAIITFQGYAPDANIYRVENLTSSVDDITFTAISLSNNLQKPVYTALVEKVSSNGLTAYVGTDDGVYKTSDYTAATVNWTKEEAFPSVPVYDLFQQTANLPSVQFTTYVATNASNNVYSATKYPGAIYAATYGKGLFMNYDNVTEEHPEPVSLNTVEQLTTTNVDLYPNPAQNRTTLSYTLSSSSNVTLNIFDMNGRLVSSLNKGNQGAGLHTQEISLNSLNKGVYMIQIITNQTSEAVKLIVQ